MACARARGIRTQRALAEEVAGYTRRNVTEAQISRWSLGKRVPPHWYARALWEMLELEMDEEGARFCRAFMLEADHEDAA